MKSTHLTLDTSKTTTRCTKDARKLLIAADGVAPTCKVCLRGTSYPQPSPMDETTIKTTWAAFQVADTQHNKRGLAFGKALFEYREDCEVVRGGTTFSNLLAKHKIPRTTAYFWLEKYAVSIGMKRLKKERVNNRSYGNFDEIKDNALEIVKAGVKAITADGKKSPLEIERAKGWAQARLKGTVLNEDTFTQADMKAEYERGYTDGLKAGRECGTNANVPQTEEARNGSLHV
jgi:hypothetical protein